MTPATIADALERIGRSIRRGAAVAGLLAMIYGMAQGLVGDAFVEAARVAGTNVAILLFAGMTLTALYGATIVVETAIGLAVLTAAVRRSRRAG